MAGGKILVSLVLEALLKSALETMTTLKTMDAEGRTEMTPEEETKLQAATDAAGNAARQAGSTL